MQIYCRFVKRGLDILLSALALVLLGWLMLLLALVIYLDDPGPVMFRQKRFGLNKKFFYMHKFRTMKTDAPHDVPTHLMENPDQYITRVGRVLRRYSLDELPQILDIFSGRMSVVGPRPALWNQDDLIAERDLYRANDVKPGLTGWAQINGRDELSIAEKSRYDGEYAAALLKGGRAAIRMDAGCVMRTVRSVIRHEGVAEGGTQAGSGQKEPK